MAQVILFVGAMIIFLSLFLVETKKSMPFFTPFSYFLVYVILTNLSFFFFLFDNAADIPCDSRNDCPRQILPRYVLCVNGLCRIYFPWW